MPQSFLQIKNPEIQRLQDLEEHFRDAIELRQIRLACQAFVKSGSVTVQKLESES